MDAKTTSYIDSQISSAVASVNCHWLKSPDGNWFYPGKEVSVGTVIQGILKYLGCGVEKVGTEIVVREMDEKERKD